MASTDTLTLLYNRRHFEQVIRREVDRRNRYKLALSVVMIDIDHFKAINDTYGFVYEGNHINLTMSLGVAGIATTGGITEPENLMKAADKALYDAKNGGRNRYVRAPDINSKPDNNSEAA